MIILEEFVIKYYSDASDRITQEVTGFIQKLNSIIGDRNEKEVLVNQDVLCRSFYLQSACSISRTHYLRRKSFLINLFDYLGIENYTIPTIKEVINSCSEKTTFFKNLDDLLVLIDNVGEMVLTTYNPTEDLAIVKALVILSWYGVSAEDIISLQPLQLKEVKDKYSIKDSHYNIVRIVDSLVSYHGLPSGRLIRLKDDSEYLFRPSVNSLEDAPREKYVTQTLDRFNKVIPSSLNFAIYFRNLRKNAQFVMIHDDNSNISLLDKISKHTGCSAAHRFGIKASYEIWLNTYFEEKV